MIPKLKSAPLHPFFISVFPILALYLHNKEIIFIGDIYGPLLWVLLGATLALLLLGRQVQQAGLLTTCFFLFLFSYSDFYEALMAWQPAGFFSHQAVLLPLYLVLFGLAAFLIHRVPAAHLPPVTALLNGSAGAIFVFQLFRVLSFQVDQAREFPASQVTPPLAIRNQSRMALADYPDIVYLVLDGYGRQDVLSRNYQFNNEAFISFLKRKNFYVAEKSTANYVRTVLSLSSSLNFDYLQQMIPEKEHRKMTYLQLIPLIKRARITEFLKQNHYHIKTFTTGYAPVEMDYEAEVQNEAPRLSEFSYLVLRKTPFRIVEQNAFLNQALQGFKHRLGIEIDPYLLHRDHILAPAAQLPGILDKDHPTFVFADMIVGHPPFIFSGTGQFIRPPYPFSFQDGNHYFETARATPQDYINGYKNQLTYINALLEQTIEKVLAKQKRPLVFIIQGDHGPGGHFHEEELAQTRVGERFANLSTFYFSDKDTSLLYRHITPVNIFRVVLNKYFAAGLPLLRDLNYYSPNSAIGQFTPVTEQLKPYR